MEERQACANQAEWMLKATDFVNKACTLWKLPLLQALAKETVPITGDVPPAKRRRLRMLDDCVLIRSPSDADPPLTWKYGAKELIFIVDCKPLQQIICGHAPLRNDELAPVLHKMSENIAFVMELGWNSPCHQETSGRELCS